MSQQTNLALFQGVKTVTFPATSKPSGIAKGATMTWSIQGAQYDADITVKQCTVPGIDNGDAGWWKFIIDPQSAQSSYTFGYAWAMQIARVCLSNLVDPTVGAAFMQGRVIVYIPSTGQTFLFLPKNNVAALVANFENEFAPSESDTSIVPIALASGSTMEVWVEGSIMSDAPGTSPTYGTPTQNIVLTLFNFNINSAGDI